MTFLVNNESMFSRGKGNPHTEEREGKERNTPLTSQGVLIFIMQHVT